MRRVEGPNLGAQERADLSQFAGARTACKPHATRATAFVPIPSTHAARWAGRSFLHVISGDERHNRIQFRRAWVKRKRPGVGGRATCRVEQIQGRARLDGPADQAGPGQAEWQRTPHGAATFELTMELVQPLLTPQTPVRVSDWKAQIDEREWLAIKGMRLGGRWIGMRGYPG